MGEDMTEAEFDLLIRERSFEPEVRALMPVLNDLFDGDCYSEDEDGFRWLVIDATRIIDFTAEGHTVAEAMYDSGRWAEDEPIPADLLAALETALALPDSGRRPDDG